MLVSRIDYSILENALQLSKSPQWRRGGHYKRARACVSSSEVYIINTLQVKPGLHNLKVISPIYFEQISTTKSICTSPRAMVSSRNRSSTSSESTSSKVLRPPLDEWTTREKLCLASLAIKHGNAWNSVARNMQAFIEKDRPDGWSNQRTCAAQFDKLMNELGVDKRPKRNEPSDGNSSAVIYKKMAEKRVKELEDSIMQLRKMWLNVKSDLDALESGSLSVDRSDQLKQKIKPAPTGSKTKTNLSESEKPPTRALTRRESSRQNLEKTLSFLCKEASEIKSINLFCKPMTETDREFYDKVILKHIDISVIKKRLGNEVEDPYAVINDLLIMFQNATMFYPPEHPTYRAAIELREKLVPQWEKALLDRFKAKH